MCCGARCCCSAVCVAQVINALLAEMALPEAGYICSRSPALCQGCCQLNPVVSAGRSYVAHYHLRVKVACVFAVLGGIQCHQYIQICYVSKYACYCYAGHPHGPVLLRMKAVQAAAHGKLVAALHCVLTTVERRCSRRILDAWRHPL